MLLATTHSVMSKYTATIVGSSATATLATRGKPPKITLPTTPAIDMPMRSDTHTGAVSSNRVPWISAVS